MVTEEKATEHIRVRPSSKTELEDMKKHEKEPVADVVDMLIDQHKSKS